MRLLVALALCVVAVDAAAVVRVGSKKFTESVILGEIATQLLRDADVAVVHRRELGGTRVLWDALRRGDLDVYPEYTGTIATELLGKPELVREDALRSSVAEQGLRMSGSLGFADNYALGVPEATAERLGLRTLSDLARHPELRFGLSEEFLSRADGWPALVRAYGLPQQPRGLDHDLAYRGIATGALDVTDLYSTDAEALHLHLRVLDDDRRVFPSYEAVLLSSPALPVEVRRSLDRLVGRIDAEAMRAMNARVKIERIPESVVAAEFLSTTFGLPPGPAPDGLLRRLGRSTREHLALVGLSLSAAIVCAIPLGILAARRRRLGAVILAITGVVQTIPSLALLVFMIPLLGIGTRPAIVALFAYSLLPIVRNTQGGLAGIPEELRESARALGLSSRARLRLIDLPLASPAILAGIKTAAVINVGTATLGALIGAGGYGQPILTGIRLADVGLILEGAVPAALLALVVQGLFALAERRLVPRGLRPP